LREDLPNLSNRMARAHLPVYGVVYGDSTYDARQHLMISPLYVIPTRSGSLYSPCNLLISGWQVSAIRTLATGFPFDISYADGTANSPWCSNFTSFYACLDVPMQVASLTPESPRSPSGSAWFSPAGFGSFGNVHRDPYHGPGTNSTNMIVAKDYGDDHERGCRPPNPARGHVLFLSRSKDLNSLPLQIPVP
jgi:hypothetical protein